MPDDVASNELLAKNKENRKCYLIRYGYGINRDWWLFKWDCVYIMNQLRKK